MNLNSAGLTLWAYDKLDPPFGLHDVLTGPINL
jgi:hypothetical protein